MDLSLQKRIELLISEFQAFIEKVFNHLGFPYIIVYRTPNTLLAVSVALQFSFLHSLRDVYINVFVCPRTIVLENYLNCRLNTY